MPSDQSRSLSREEIVAMRKRRFRRRRLGALAVVIVVGACAWAIVALASGEEVDQAAPAAGTATQAVTQPAADPAAAEPAEFITRGPAMNVVALTFDDGSCAECVGALAEWLARTKTPATIFPNGVYADRWQPHLAAWIRLLRRGQVEIGNHTLDHANVTEFSAEELADNLSANEDWIRRAFSADPRPFFRPPYGAYDEETLAIAGSLGYSQLVTWSVGSGDWDTKNAKVVSDRVAEELEPGAIVLLHANGMWTIKALPRIRKLLEERGLRPVTLSDLLQAHA